MEVEEDGPTGEVGHRVTLEHDDVLWAASRVQATVVIKGLRPPDGVRSIRQRTRSAVIRDWRRRQEWLLEDEDGGPAEAWTLTYSGWILGIGAFGATLIALLSLFVVPGWRSDGIEDQPPSATFDQQFAVDQAKRSAEAEVRDTGLRIALAFGAISAALVAYGRLQLSRSADARSERGQANERWTTAVRELGSEHAEVRLGGVYALEQFFDDVPDERPRTASVLASFVRANLPPNAALPEVRASQRPAPLPVDVQAAISVIGHLWIERHEYPTEDRRRFSGLFGRARVQTVMEERAHLPEAHEGRIDLSRIDASLGGRYSADLTGAYLTGGAIARSGLTDADLSVATLTRTDMTGVILVRANLEAAKLMHANLAEANLAGANLVDADLAGAELGEADLARADLAGAHLCAANLLGADLSDSNLAGIRYDDRTTWPQGFSPPSDATIHS